MQLYDHIFIESDLVENELVYGQRFWKYARM